MTTWNTWLPHSLLALLVAIALLAGMTLSIGFRKLTPTAALTGGVVGWIIYLGAGIPGLLVLTAFFLLGTLATSWKREEKNAIDPEIAGNENGHSEGPASEKRKTGQVLANAGVAALLALAAILYPAHARSFRLVIAASFASATADTLSSELGMVYGRRFYNCLNWKKDSKGRDGVVSMEGTLIGIAGAALIAGIDGLSIGWNRDWVWRFLIIVIAGVIGNFADSALGATLERKGLLGNDAVNFLSTATAALVASLLFSDW